MPILQDIDNDIYVVPLSIEANDRQVGNLES